MAPAAGGGEGGGGRGGLAADAPAAEAVGLEVEALATAEEVFGAKISDHVPFAVRVSHASLPEDGHFEVFSWNVMARALCRPPAKGAAGAAQANNGLDIDETMGAYEERLSAAVGPRLGAWIGERSDAGRPWLACLQEAPAHAAQLADLLAATGAAAGLPRSRLRHRLLRESASAASVTLWDARQWRELLPGRSSSSSCSVALPASLSAGRTLLTDLAPAATAGGSENGGRRRGAAVRLWNCHLASPPSSAGGGGSEGSSEVLSLLTAAPEGCLALVLGDLNRDIRGLGKAALASGSDFGVSAEFGGALAVAALDGSALYKGEVITADGAAAAFSRGGGAGSSNSSGRRASDSADADKAWGSTLDDLMPRGPLDGLSRAEFIEKSINYTLQARVRHLSAGGLCDEDLGRLGGYHFGDQVEVLDRWQASGRAASAEQPTAAPVPLSPSAAGPPGAATAEEKEKDPFGGEAARRAAYVAKHVHTRLQGSIAGLSNQQLWLLGQLPYREQPAELRRLTSTSRPQGPSSGARAPAAAAEGSRQAQRPRGPAPGESNESAMWRLLASGAGSAGACASASHAAAASSPPPPSPGATAAQPNSRGGFFEGLLGCSREEYIRKHVDFKLQEQVGHLDDPGVFKVGQVRYSEQASALQRIRKERQHSRREAWGDDATRPPSSSPWDDAPPRAAMVAPGTTYWGAGTDEEEGEEEEREEQEEGACVPQRPPCCYPDEAGWEQREQEQEEREEPQPRQFQEGRLPEVRAAEEAQEEEVEAVPGLAAFLAELRLRPYLAAASRWCVAMGAVSLEEVQENAWDLAQDIGLKPLEARRLLRAAGGGAGDPAGGG